MFTLVLLLLVVVVVVLVLLVLVVVVLLLVLLFLVVVLLLSTFTTCRTTSWPDLKRDCLKAWKWSNGQCACLQARRSEFESH